LYYIVCPHYPYIRVYQLYDTVQRGDKNRAIYEMFGMYKNITPTR